MKSWDLKAYNKLREGEIECSKCKGIGSDSDGFRCMKCGGNGKVDWVSNVMGPKLSRSALDNVNIRRLLSHIKKTVENSFAVPSLTKKPNALKTVAGYLDGYLTSMKQNKAIYDWKVDSDELNNTIDVVIQPVKTVEFVNLNFKIEKNLEE